MTRSFTLISLFFLTCIFACEKNELQTDESFTDCENCTFTYQASSDDSLLFSYKNYWDGKHDAPFTSPYHGLTIQIRPGINTFEYDKEEIISGKVDYIAMCVNCNTIAYEPVDGKITGKKAHNDRWLLEANVVLQGPHESHRDTMAFKQYFVREPGS